MSNNSGNTIDNNVAEIKPGALNTQGIRQAGGTFSSGGTGGGGMSGNLEIRVASLESEMRPLKEVPNQLKKLKRLGWSAAIALCTSGVGSVIYIENRNHNNFMELNNAFRDQSLAQNETINALKDNVHEWRISINDTDKDQAMLVEKITNTQEENKESLQKIFEILRGVETVK